MKREKDFENAVCENKMVQFGAGMAASGSGIGALANAAGLAHASSAGAVIAHTAMTVTTIVSAPVAIGVGLTILGLGIIDAITQD